MYAVASLRLPNRNPVAFSSRLTHSANMLLIMMMMMMMLSVYNKHTQYTQYTNTHYYIISYRILSYTNINVSYILYLSLCCLLVRLTSP